MKTTISSAVIPSSEIIHLETATIKKNSPSHYYHSAKSHLIFVFKRAPFYLKIREGLRIIKSLYELLGEKNATKKVGTISKAQIREIAEEKMEDLSANDIEAACKIIEGTAKSMGIDVK